MKLEVKLFAKARDLVGRDRVELDLPDSAHVATLRSELAERFPNLRPLVPNLLFAVGADYADDAVPLASHDEVACFPPVSGG